MKLAVLTLGNRKKVFVLTSNICAIEPFVGMNIFSRVVTSGEVIYVKETWQEIFQKIGVSIIPEDSE